MLGAALASGLPAFAAACEAVYRHGALADRWPEGIPLTAGQLAANC
jgi:NAD(P)H-hydrate repair Nnr-like enzyme with NAD(P)H-hydrate dehydratase domain